MLLKEHDYNHHKNILPFWCESEICNKITKVIYKRDYDYCIKFSELILKLSQKHDSINTEEHNYIKSNIRNLKTYLDNTKDLEQDIKNMEKQITLIKNNYNPLHKEILTDEISYLDSKITSKQIKLARVQSFLGITIMIFLKIVRKNIRYTSSLKYKKWDNPFYDLYNYCLKHDNDVKIMLSTYTTKVDSFIGCLPSCLGPNLFEN